MRSARNDRHGPLGLLSLLGLVLLGGIAGASAKDITWATDYETAIRLAGESSGVVFVAIHMEGRPDCERALELYGDEHIQKLAAQTVNLVASGDRHDSEDCSRFEGLTCEQHQAIDMDVRRHQLGSVAGRKVISPQHLFLDASGACILWVPFEVSVEELEWCFHQALNRADLSRDVKMRWEARAPRSLVWGEVSLPQRPTHVGRIDENDVMKRIDDLKRGGQSPNARLNAMKQLALLDHPEAVDFLRGVLRSGVGGGRGGGTRQKDRRPELIQWMGQASPRSYGPIVAEHIRGGTAEIQSAAIIALEQIAAPGTRKELLATLRSERDPALKKNILRAVGAVGEADTKARKALLRYAKDRDPVLRKNALLAMGFVAQHEDVVEALLAALTSEEAGDQAAAALALGLTRESSWIARLKEARKVAQDANVTAAIDGAIQVLEDERLGLLQNDVKLVGEDQAARERVFDTYLGGRQGGRRQR